MNASWCRSELVLILSFKFDIIFNHSWFFSPRIFSDYDKFSRRVELMSKRSDLLVNAAKPRALQFLFYR